MTTTARKRPKKTRTKRRSMRPPLAVSTIVSTQPHHVDLRPGARCLVCPDCGTWCPLTTHQGKHKLVPHDTLPAGDDGAGPCHLGSNRLVHIDLTLTQWLKAMERFDRDKVQPQSRRTARQFYKPIPPTGAPVVRIAQSRNVPGDTGQDSTHRERCPVCRHREQLRAERERFARTTRPARRREQRWSDLLPAVQRADAERIPAGAASTEKGPKVPLEPLHVRTTNCPFSA
ncbi:hypothetical protein [Streptomyces nanshensis]|uniref:hypothetical protein n=1 Tax=Streptomyces nanshensis TaxID=518642 RepID=UPI00085C9395|nr:hypothetical protein [Streptomyces nanshensis]